MIRYSSFTFTVFPLQEYSFQVTLRQQWNDKRLRFAELLKAKGVGDGNTENTKLCFGGFHLKIS